MDQDPPRTYPTAIAVQNMRCVRCGAAYKACGCWVECSCGWSYEKGGECRNPYHARAEFVANTVIVEMTRVYPVPMKHASGGFRQTLRQIVDREVFVALQAEDPRRQ